MIRFTLFNTRKPRKFDYRPRFFDPEKEERERRKKELLGENYQDAYRKEGEDRPEYKPGQYVGELRMRRGIIARRDKEAVRRRRTLRVIVLLILFAVAGYWLMS